jgi:enhancer of mRNA-decapping protein 3
MDVSLRLQVDSLIVLYANPFSPFAVFVPGTKDWAPEMRIEALNIADLSEVKLEQPAVPYFAAKPPVEAAAAPVQHPLPPPHPLDDPAILSLGRPPGATASVSSEQLPPSPRFLSAGEVPLDFLDDSDVPGVLRGIHVGRDERPFTPGNEPPGYFEALQLQNLKLAQNGSVQNGAHPIENGGLSEIEEDKAQKKKRRPRKSTRQKQDIPEGSPAGNVQTSGRGKGWRQTPMLESTASFQPFNSLKTNSRGRKGANDYGWASEDVTEEMGDFDFENNLAKFDKRTIFDQMRLEDQVDDASRLVSHNRRPKPGTNGGKNLHYTENVLDLPTTIAKTTDFWNSEADDSMNGTERQSIKRQPANRRAESKNGGKGRSSSRRASGAVTGPPLTRVNSAQAHQPSQAGLYLSPSNRKIDAISTLQMLNLENIAANEVGFTEDLMAENAGRGIAEVAVRSLSDPAIKVRFDLAADGASAEEALSSSTTVVLAGNNKSSIRAVAGARHLRNRGFDVIVCVVGLGNERDLMEDLRRQIDLYRRFGGKLMSKNEFFEHLRKARVAVSLIIDALLGLTISFEELRVGDQATVYELMEWANRNEAFVLSIDVPSGIDATTGKIAIIDGAPLYVKPRYVVAVGAPKRGLLEAVTPPSEDDPEPLLYPAHEDEWRLYLADMGLGSAVWKKSGTKIRRGVDFDGQWVLEMHYLEHAPASD